MKEFKVISEYPACDFEWAMQQAFEDGWNPVAFFCNEVSVNGATTLEHTAYLTRDSEPVSMPVDAMHRLQVSHG